MSEVFEVTELEASKLAETAKQHRGEGYRLVQVCANRLPESFEILYSFDRKEQLVNYRVEVPAEGATLPSISESYLAAFAYENEIKDLFGIEVTGLVLDFGGNFLKTKVKTPFADAPPPPKKKIAVKKVAATEDAENSDAKEPAPKGPICEPAGPYVPQPGDDKAEESENKPADNTEEKKES